MKKIIDKPLLFLIFFLVFLVGLTFTAKPIVYAEQSGASPESGSDSRIKTAYEWLVAKGANYGAADALDWDSLVTYPWGTNWNRIMESAVWEPDGSATTGDVLSGLTFYAGNGNRTIKTGTITDREGDSASSSQFALGGVNYLTPLTGFYDGDDRVSATDAQVVALDTDLVTGNVRSGVTVFGVAGNSNVVDTSSGDAVVADILSGKKAWVDGAEVTGGAAAAVDYSYQSLVEWDDYKTGDETGEEASWTNPATNVWKDGRTNLYWSNSLGQYSNIFPDTTHTACPFFSTSPRGSYDGLDADCGNAINACGTLSLATDGGAAKTDWYLPSQKELQQAYIDGIYNANASWATTSYFWSSTETSDLPTFAWFVYLNGGYTYYNTKVTATVYVRCVRRD